MPHFIRGKRVACDTESTGLNPWKGDRPFAFSFANVSGQTAYFEFPVDPLTRRVLYAKKPKTFAKLKRFFADRRIEKVFHNAKHDIRMLEAAGIKVRGKIFDTEFKLRICDSTRQSYELKPVCEELFGISKADQKELSTAVAGLRTRAKRLGWMIAADNEADYWLVQHAKTILTTSVKLLKTYKNATPAARKKMVKASRRKAEAIAAKCQTYAVTDAERTIALDTFLENKLDEYEVRHIYEEEMREVFPVVYAMEGRGVYLDQRSVRKGRKKAVKQLKKHTATIERLCGKSKRELNPDTFPNSYPQKVEYFLEELKLEPLHFNKKSGNAKLDSTFLEFYAESVPMCGAIQGEGFASKVIGYFDDYATWIDVDGILHASFQQCGAKTGRFSCRWPNLQQVPKRAKKGSSKELLLEVRRPFRPRPGFVWYMLDFSQIEARLFADYAEEEFMLRSFRKGRDVYQDFADVIARETKYDISRQDTKSIFLGKLYGLGLKKLIKQIMDAMHGQKVDEDDARSVIDCFDESFPRVAEFMAETMDYAKENLCVYNRYGQRIDILPPRFDFSTGRTIDDSYKGVNYIIQSSAARLMKRAMVKCAAYLKSIGFGWLVMTIHDELVFEFPVGKPVTKHVQTLADLMGDNEGKFPLVKTPVEVSKTAGSWLDSVECEWVLSS